MIRNVILIDYEPFTKRREELFFIRNFIDSGFNVQIWDISKYLYRTVHIVDTIENRNYIFKVSTYTQLKCLLESTTTPVVIVRPSLLYYQNGFIC